MAACSVHRQSLAGICRVHTRVLSNYYITLSFQICPSTEESLVSDMTALCSYEIELSFTQLKNKMKTSVARIWIRKHCSFFSLHIFPKLLGLSSASVQKRCHTKNVNSDHNVFCILFFKCRFFLYLYSSGHDSLLN